MIKLNCEYCDGNAEGIIYYTKIYSWGNYTIVKPALCCRDCFDLGKKNILDLPQYKILFMNTGSIDTVKFLSFIRLAKQDVIDLVTFLSNSGKEVNELNNKYWRKKLWHIYYMYGGKKPKRKPKKNLNKMKVIE